MAVIVGTNSYVTIAEADEYMAENFVLSDETRTAWEALSDAEKEVYLRNAVGTMERLMYIGLKADSEQNLAFPRALHDYTQEEVPQDVIVAQILEAAELAHPTQDSTTAKTFGGNIRSYSVGQMGEGYAVVDAFSLCAVINSKKAQLLLRPYVGGGYRVR